MSYHVLFIENINNIVIILKASNRNSNNWNEKIHHRG
jgi:hypothetical protein